MTRVVLTRLQAITLGEAITAHCHQNAAHMAVYDEGWNDQKIATHLGPPFTKWHVYGLRARLIGVLADSPSVKNRSAVTPSPDTPAGMESPIPGELDELRAELKFIRDGFVLLEKKLSRRIAEAEMRATKAERDATAALSLAKQLDLATENP